MFACLRRWQFLQGAGAGSGPCSVHVLMGSVRWMGGDGFIAGCGDVG
jgi:hypothetical protein